MAVVAITLLGVRLGRGASRTLEGWVVNNRSMGPVMTWFLLGTEVYTAFTFLGLAGFAYARGGGVFYNVATNDVGYAIGFFLLPAMWLLGRRFGYVTQSDFIEGRYQSRGLGIFTGLCTALIMIAYVDLNIEGLGCDPVGVARGPDQPIARRRLAGFVILTLGGVLRRHPRQCGAVGGEGHSDVRLHRGACSCWCRTISSAASARCSSGWPPRCPNASPCPARRGSSGMSWFTTTVLLTGFGQWMWPQWFNVAFTGRGPRTLKLQAVFMPFYQLVKVAVITVGFAAILIFAGNSVAGNDVVMTLAKQLFPTWFLCTLRAGGGAERRSSQRARS